MEEATKLKQITVRTTTTMPFRVSLTENSTDGEFVQVYNADGWITLYHGVKEVIDEVNLESGESSSYTVHKTKKRITIPANIVTDILEEFAD